MNTRNGMRNSRKNGHVPTWPFVSLLMVLCMVLSSQAVTYYVDASRPDDSGDGLSWATAKHTIQAAVDAAGSEEAFVRVNDGVYDVGTSVKFLRTVDPGGPNCTTEYDCYRLRVDGPITIQSENGPGVTIIDALLENSEDTGPHGVGGVKLENGAKLVGFSVINARSDYTVDYGSGGCRTIYRSCGEGITANDCTVENCIVKNNNGGGISGGNIFNSAIIGNSSSFGGGVSGGKLYNCTVVSNHASNAGGGVYYGTLKNCIVWGNTCSTNDAWADYYSADFNHSCTVPLPSGTGNICLDPCIIDDRHISPDSPCAGAGSAAYASGVDIDGDTWLNPPSMGCDEPTVPEELRVLIHADAESVSAGMPVVFTAQIDGTARSNRWDFIPSGRVAENTLSITNSSMDLGEYQVVFTAYNDENPAGVSVTQNVAVLPGTFYVWKDSPSPEYPYTTWETAAHSIQTAVSAVNHSEALIRVRDGIHDNNCYREFIRMIDPGPHCTSVYKYYCLVVDGPITIQSENGPETAIIKANASSTSGNIGGIVLRNGAKLIGFTVMNARTYSGCSYRVSYSSYGRGIVASGSTVRNCIVKDNGDGGISGGTVYNTKIINNSNGGAFGGVYHNCLIADNLGSGAYGTLYNCTVVGNHTSGDGGGVTGGNLYNCIVWGNTSVSNPATANYSGGNFQYCCTDPMPVSGTGNISADPQMIDAGHISSDSPCVGAGLYMYCFGTDIDGEFWRNPSSMGCDEVMPSSSTGSVVVVISSAASVKPGVELSLTAQVTGTITSNTWDFGDGSFLFNQSSVAHSWSVDGSYDVVFTAYGPTCPDGVSATQIVTVSEYDGVLYVDAESGDDTWSGSSWTAAKKTIQAAVDAASGQPVLIRVAAGVYNSGGSVGGRYYDPPTNRVCVDGPITIQSEDGPEATIIEGAPDPATGEKGHGAIRGAYLQNGARLIGFTVTKGYSSGSSCPPDESGGGICCGSNCVVESCIITGNSAVYGGGVCGGTLNNCIIRSNTSSWYGGGASGGILNNCLLEGNIGRFGGGGAYQGTLNNCRLVGNIADDPGAGYYGGPFGGMGGGARESTLVNCLLSDNTSKRLGGGAYDCMLSGCTVIRNSADLQGGGTYECVQNNSIVFDNTTTSGMDENYYAGTFSYCCTVPLPLGAGNITGNPEMADARHISASSPCVGAGSSDYTSGADIDGDAWQNPPSIGCDEYAASATGTLTVDLLADYTLITVGYAQQWTLQIDGHALSNKWVFGDGEIYENCLSVTHTWDTPGDYSVVALVYNSDYPDGLAVTQEVSVVPEAAVTYYVRQDSVSPAPPYATWETAAHTIQDAVDQAVETAGAIIRVADGCYRSGGAVASGETLTNRVYASGPVTIKSENGPEMTIIEGAADITGGSPSNGPAAIRGVYLSDKASLVGFTVSNGYASDGGGIYADLSCMISNCSVLGNYARSGGGGVFDGKLFNCRLAGNTSDWAGGGILRGALYNCVVEENVTKYYGGGSRWSLIENCIISSNVATTHGSGGGASHGILNNCRLIGNEALDSGAGGGAALATLNNCELVGNLSQSGAGASGCVLNNCTLVDNTALLRGGGSSGGTMNNCIVWGNHCITNAALANYYTGTFNYSCTTPLPTNGENNISSDPCLIDSYHIASNSPCIGAGSAAYVSGVDMDGDTWLNPPSIGCDEPTAGSSTGVLEIVLYKETANPMAGDSVTFSVDVTGGMTSNRWDFGDGSIIENETSVTHAWLAEGTYQLLFTAYNPYYPQGKTVQQTIIVASSGAATTYYVDASRPDDSGDGLSWATAKQSIQAAVDAAGSSESLVLVTNGIYNAGGEGDGSVLNRVRVTVPVTIQSVNGPEVTVIDAEGNASWSNRVERRAVFMVDNACLSGFTITKGFVNSRGSAAVWAGTNCVISNCVLVGNTSGDSAGVAYGGIYYDCLIKDNVGCGVETGVLYRCEISNNSKGGAKYSTLYNSVLSGNRSHYFGGGAYGGTLYNCLLTQNSADIQGGGAYRATLVNCTVVDNLAEYDGGGAYDCTLDNCIIWGNTSDESGVRQYNSAVCVLSYCDTVPAVTSGVGNISSDPLFVDPENGDYRLSAGSPCRNSGNNAALPEGLLVDIAGNLRIYDGRVDMGAYESQTELTYYTISVHVGPHGRAYPEGDSLLVASNASLSLRFVPDDWYEVDEVTVNGSSFEGDVDLFYWANIVANGTVDVSFVEMSVSNHPPMQHWMAKYKMAGIPEQQDEDGDGVNAWQEYIMDTDPADQGSLLKLDVAAAEKKPYAMQSQSSSATTTEPFVLRWQGSSNRVYTVYCSTNLTEGFTEAVLEDYRPAESGAVTFTDEPEESAGIRYYRIKAALP